MLSRASAQSLGSAIYQKGGDDASRSISESNNLSIATPVVETAAPPVTSEETQEESSEENTLKIDTVPQLDFIWSWGVEVPHKKKSFCLPYRVSCQKISS